MGSSNWCDYILHSFLYLTNYSFGIRKGVNTMKYADHDPLYTIQQGYNEATRMLMFHSTPLDFDKLEEALNIIGSYNNFDSKKVFNALQKLGENYYYVVGREFSPVIYIKARRTLHWDEQRLSEIKEISLPDEVDIDDRGELRLWWDQPLTLLCRDYKAKMRD